MTAVKSGTLKVTKDGIIFTVELSAVTLDDKQVNFYYKGKPVVSNYE